ncbi:MAG: PrpF family protein, partial [Ramlibacter sp.]|nr:PrpF family protein [Ramlibacter sp.]
DFLDPGGAATGRLLPTGRARDTFEIDGLGAVEVSVVDAANPCVFVRAADLGLTGAELPAQMEDQPQVLAQLHAIGRHALVAAGLAPDLAAARARSLPLIAWVAPSLAASDLSGHVIAASDADLCVRMLSDGQPHRALPMTGSICTAVAARIPGSVVAECASAANREAVRLSMPSGVIHVDAAFEQRGELPHALRGSVWRTARRLFEGRVCISDGDPSRVTDPGTAAA